MIAPSDQLEAKITAACRLIGSRPDVHQVTVIGQRRLTADEYARLQQQAAASHVEIWTDGSGTFRLYHDDPRLESGTNGVSE